MKDTLHDRELEELFDEALSHAEDLLNRKGTCNLFSALLSLKILHWDNYRNLRACYKGA